MEESAGQCIQCKSSPRAGNLIRGHVKAPKNVNVGKNYVDIAVGDKLTSGFHMGSGKRIARATNVEKSRKRTPALTCTYQVVNVAKRCVERFRKERARHVEAMTSVIRLGPPLEHKRFVGSKGMNQTASVSCCERYGLC